MVVKLSSNECRSARMWCCWISPDDNPVSTQRRVERSKYRTARVVRVETRVSIRLRASTRQSVRRRVDAATGNLVPTACSDRHLFNHLTVSEAQFEACL